jgi:hypothetical protein
MKVRRQTSSERFKIKPIIKLDLKHSKYNLVLHSIHSNRTANTDR